MTRDEVLRLAREAGVMVIDNDDYEYGVEFHSDICGMERFAALVAAAERAKHDDQIKSLGESITRQYEAAEQLAARILNSDSDIAVAVAAEREACLEDVRTVGGQFSVECEALMRKRWGAS